MNIDRLLSTDAEWARADGPHHQIVISSRIRLARNLRNHPFPGWAKKTDRLQILELIKPQVEALPEMADAFSAYLQTLTPLEKQLLVERHLISREHAAKSAGSAVVVNPHQTLSIMINEEDHLRMQVLRSGLQLSDAFQSLDKAEADLQSRPSDCANACRALASMEKATVELCTLAGEGDDATHCADARRRLLSARDRVRLSCGGCPDGPSVDRSAPIPSTR